jgi:fused signal recognition particle receptor
MKMIIVASVVLIVLLAILLLAFFYFLQKARNKKRQTTSYTSSNIKTSLLGEVDLNKLEKSLLQADVGVPTTKKILESLNEEQVFKDLTDQDVRDKISEIFSESPELSLDTTKKPNVILVSGVNGVGKTTTIGKLAYLLKNNGNKVLLVPADTFRAAAESQLGVWAERADVDVLISDHKDPAALAFAGVAKGVTEKFDIVIIDTAGRLHTKKPLMEQLAKIHRSISKAGGNLVESLLVLDATTGQNGVRQAEHFFDVVDLTGIILTKLDGSSKGGVACGVVDQFNVPIKLIGVGEGIEDLQRFDSHEFIKKLF